MTRNDHVARNRTDESTGTAIGRDGTPLIEFAWSDRIVGMGYFPPEVALREDWRWSVDGPS